MAVRVRVFLCWWNFKLGLVLRARLAFTLLLNLFWLVLNDYRRKLSLSEILVKPLSDLKWVFVDFDLTIRTSAIGSVNLISSLVATVRQVSERNRQTFDMFNRRAYDRTHRSELNFDSIKFYKRRGVKPTSAIFDFRCYKDSWLLRTYIFWFLPCHEFWQWVTIKFAYSLKVRSIEFNLLK